MMRSSKQHASARLVFTFLLAALMLLVLAGTALAGDTTIIVNGDSKTVESINSGGFTLVPAKDAAAVLGATVTWDAKAKAAAFKVGDQEILVYPGKTAVLVNGKDSSSPVASVIRSGKTLVPLRWLTESFGQKIKSTADGIIIGVEIPKADPKDIASVVKAIQAEWSVSPHGTPTEGTPPTRDTCVACHNGEGFAKGLTKAAQLKDATKPLAIGCDSCHSERGMGIAKGGLITAPNGTFTTGKGALCMSCHNSRRALDETKRSAPHRGPQTEVLTGEGGFEAEGKLYAGSPHLLKPDGCVSCHMAPVKGYPNHTFEVTDSVASDICGDCHQGFDSTNPSAYGDYDGDGKTEGIQDEVEGLMHILQEAIEASIDDGRGGTLEESHGSAVYLNAKGEEVQVSNTVYKATWNLLLVEADGSEGVHNPAYAVKLLQQSYKELTGKDVPNARIR